MELGSCCNASLKRPRRAGRGGRRAQSAAHTRGDSGALAVLHSRMSVRRLVPVCLLLLSVSACGRPATQKECDEIVVRVAELELKARGVAGSGQEVKDTKQALEKTTLRDCVGRRISDKAMACVRAAQTAEQLVNECF